ncbi:MAG TPA: hypothetical protein VNK46_05400 [Nitrospiraceae bacterium]|jgi:hypothetical protein|nr:hypothetical protein [Nitrospiraceae bacterium]
MPLIWCSISGHGYGHAAQVLPVLNELARRVPRLSAILRTTVPASFFEGRLHLDWELRPAEQDIGCVQHGPLKIDAAATWSEHGRFHRSWDAKLDAEVRAIRAARPHLVLSDISYLATAAGAQAGVPTVALGSLSWDLVLAKFADRNSEEHQTLIDRIRRAYAAADVLLRAMPGLPMDAFRRIVDIGPIAQASEPKPAALRQAVGASSEERLVLVGFGGVPLSSLPFQRLEAMAGYRFIFDGSVPASVSRIHAAAPLPFRFNILLASTDLVVSKPGYSTVVEAVTHRKPLVYVRRYNFPDEGPLVDFLHRYGRGAELPMDDFSAGRWEKALDAACAAPEPPAPAPQPMGAADAAEILTQYL